MVIFLAGPSHAHEGHDHGEAPKPAQAELAPRLEVASGEFEVLAEAHAGQLVVFLDRFDSNEPVAGGSVEVEAGTRKAILAERAPGEYTGKFDLAPGRHELTFTIRAAGSEDLLVGTLEIPAVKTPPAPETTSSWETRLRGAAIAGVILALILAAWRKWGRKKR